jgi:high-affinity Fe2+/Pb2+ permease
MQTQQSIETTVIALSNKATVTGAATAAASGVAVNLGFTVMSVGNICAIIGVCIAFVGFTLSTYFQWRRDVRESREHVERVALLVEQRHEIK